MLFSWGRLLYRLAICLTGLCSIAASGVVHFSPAAAHSASPAVQVLVQPGGNEFEARQWGDWRLSGWETIAGFTILRDSVTSNWVYAIRDKSGRLQASRLVVGRDRPTADIPPKLRPRLASQPTARSAALLPFGRRGDTPSLGTNNLLTILVNYADTKPTYAPQDFDKVLYGKGNKSLADYYAEASYGKLRITAGPAGVRGWYTISMTAAEVAQDYNKAVLEAVKAAERAGVNFAAYDMDGDCDVDTVNIVHHGGSGPAHASNIGSYGPYVTRSPCVKGGYVTVHNYITLPEISGGKLADVGGFAHEYGHVLGLPEFYDVDGSSAGSGNWTTMASGNFNCVPNPDDVRYGCASQSGDSPALMDPWSRLVLNWLSPIVIEKGAAPTRVTLPPASESPSVVLFGSGQPNSEYFLVENRQKLGFDAGLPGSGLLVWHIDDSVFMNEKECAPRLPGDCARHHYKASIVAADGKWDLEFGKNWGDDGDPFPGSSGVTSITDDTNPSVRMYSGVPSGISITSIAQSGKNVSALMAQQAFYSLSSSKGGTGRGDISITPSGTPAGCNLTSCALQYKEGVQVELTATAAPGSVFTGWSGAGCSGTVRCVVSMSSDQQVTATFKGPDSFTLTTYDPSGVDGKVVRSLPGWNNLCTFRGECVSRYEKGAVVTLTAQPPQGYEFVGWWDGRWVGDNWEPGPGCGGKGSCRVAISADVWVGAVFEKIKMNTLRRWVNGSGAGKTIRLPAGIDKGCSLGHCDFQYPNGTVVTFAAVATAGSTFSGWKGYSWSTDKWEPVQGCSGKGVCTVTMSSDVDIYAAFNKSSNPDQILNFVRAGDGSGTVSFSPAGSFTSCTENCANKYPVSTVVKLTAAPAADSVFSGWSGAGCSGTGTCSVTMSAAQAVRATFVKAPLPSLSLNFEVAGSGSGSVAFSPAGSLAACSSGCANSYAQGTVVKLTATPAASSIFSGWSGAGCSGTGTCSVTMSAAQAVRATFDKAPPPTVSLNVEVGGSGSGSVAFSPAGSLAACSSGCANSYAQGTVVKLTATSAAGSVFSGWSGAGCSGTGTCTLTMSAAMAVTAKFDKLPVYILSYSKSGSGAGTVAFTPAGTVSSCAANCSAGFAAGTEVTVTAIPAPGSAFTGWSGRSGCSGTGTCKLTMTKALALRASFKKLPTYALSYSKTGKGSGTVAFSPGGQKPVCASRCTNTYVSGTVVTLTAAAQPGSVFLGWSGNRSCSGTGPCTLTLSRAQSVKANFSPARTSSLPN